MTTILKRWLAKAPDMSAVIVRFPVAVGAMALFTIIVIVVGFDQLDNRQNIGRLSVGLIIAAYLSVSMTLSSEGRDRLRNLLLQIFAAAVIAVLAWFSEGLRINLVMALGAVILILGNSVRWRRERDDTHVWDFTHKLWTGALFATVGSIIFLLGMLFITEALKTLFGLNIRRLTQDLIYPIAFGFLAPLYWLSTLPPANEDYAELYDNPGFVSKAVGFLGTWLLAPLTLIYALILLAYGVKIGLSMSLPKGEIAGLTLPFLIIGALTWLVLEPPFIGQKTLAKLFRRLWWPLSIPASILLGIAVFVRIREYGYTPERFALTIGVTWALVMGLWFTFGPKAKRDIRLIPASAATLLLLGTFSAGWLSQVNQGMRLQQNLVKAGIMSADGIVPTAVSVSDTDAARKAKGALKYLWDHEGKERVAAILAKTDIVTSVPQTTDKEAMHPEKDHLATVEAALGLDKISTPNRWSQGDEINFNRQSQMRPVTGFDAIQGPVSIYNSNIEQSISKNTGFNGTMKNGVLTLELNSGERVTFDAIAWIDSQNLGFGTITADGFEIDIFSDESRGITLSIDRFNLWTETNSGADKPTRRMNMEFYILTRGLD